MAPPEAAAVEKSSCCGEISGLLRLLPPSVLRRFRRASLPGVALGVAVCMGPVPCVPRRPMLEPGIKPKNCSQVRKDAAPGVAGWAVFLAQSTKSASSGLLSMAATVPPARPSRVLQSNRLPLRLYLVWNAFER